LCVYLPSSTPNGNFGPGRRGQRQQAMTKRRKNIDVVSTKNPVKKIPLAKRVQIPVKPRDWEIISGLLSILRTLLFITVRPMRLGLNQEWLTSILPIDQGRRLYCSQIGLSRSRRIWEQAVEASKGEFNKHDPANTPASISGKQLKSVSSDKLISLAAANASFFTSPDETAWASVEVKSHRETHAINSPRFKTWLIDGDGWRVRPRTPVPFRRQKGMLALPEPVRGGSIEALRPFLNVARNDDFIPDPLLALAGEPGAAKSTAAKRSGALSIPMSRRCARRRERSVTSGSRRRMPAR
jgi:hypothetical protein